MRHLIYALEASGNYVEAERSLDAYLAIVENEKKTLETARMNNEGIQDVDANEDILRTMAFGIRILVKFQNNGKKALQIAQRTEEYVKAWNIDNSQVLGVVWHAIGIANSLWSMQSIISFLRI